MKTKALILALLPLGALVAYREHTPARPVALSEKARAEEAKALAEAPPAVAMKRLRRAYLAVSPAEDGPAMKRGIALLAAGLTSGDEELRRRSAAHAENLFVKLAHGKIALSPELQSDVSELARLYRQNAQDQIHRMEQAAPQSPTLAFLRNN